MADTKFDNPDTRHFASIPWCAKHLGKPNVVSQIAPSRIPQDTQEHELISRTLNSDSTIKAFVVSWERPRDARTPVYEMRAFVTLGPGVNGYPGVCHGGIVATILDEVMGFLGPLNRNRPPILDADYMTAYLNTQYIVPVPTGTTLMVDMRITKVDGRKCYLEGHIEDESGRKLATADSLYVGLKPKTKL
jgi:acyl-coenzyme A thioesterase PaaI-like protein